MKRRLFCPRSIEFWRRKVIFVFFFSYLDGLFKKRSSFIDMISKDNLIKL